MLLPEGEEMSANRHATLTSKTFSAASFQTPPSPPEPSSNNSRAISEMTAETAGGFTPMKVPAPGLRYARSLAGSSANNSRCASAVKHQSGVPQLNMARVCMGDDENGDDEEIYAKHSLRSVAVHSVPSLNMAAFSGEESAGISDCEAARGVAFDAKRDNSMIKPVVPARQSMQQLDNGMAYKSAPWSQQPAFTEDTTSYDFKSAAPLASPGMGRRSMTTGSLRANPSSPSSSQGSPPASPLSAGHSPLAAGLRLPPVNGRRGNSTSGSTRGELLAGPSHGQEDSSKSITASSFFNKTKKVQTMKHVHSHHHYHYHVKVRPRSSSKGQLAQLDPVAGSRRASQALKPVEEVLA